MTTSPTRTKSHEDDTLSLSTTLRPDSEPIRGLPTYRLPSTPESNLPVSTKLKFARDGLLSKLKLGEKSAEQLKEEELERRREGERRVRQEARNKGQEKGGWFRMSGDMPGGNALC